MYKIEKTTLEEYERLSPKGIEVGDLCYDDAFRSFIFEKMIVDGDVVAIIARGDEYIQGNGVTSVSALIFEEIKKHMREIKKFGVKYLDSIQELPLLAEVQEDYPAYSKFLEYLGFTRSDKTLDYVDENGIMYTGYIRK